MQDKRFVVLDSLRGVCALLVAVHNLNYGHWLPQAAFVAHSSLFVDFFFILSGFIMTHTYFGRLTQAPHLWAFLIRRIGRLWPLHVTILAILVIMYCFGLAIEQIVGLRLNIQHDVSSRFTQTVVSNLLLIQTFDQASYLTWNSPSWSISAELWTYFLFSLLCVSAASSRSSSLFTFIMAGVVLFAGATLFIFSPRFLETNTDYAFCRCLYGFSAGYFAYQAWSHPLFGALASGITEALAVALVSVFVFYVGNDIRSMMAPLIFGFTVLIFAYERAGISNVLMAAPFTRLGAWSYSIYMSHWVIRNLLREAEQVLQNLSESHVTLNFVSANDAWMRPLLLSGYLIIVVIFASQMFRLIEQPGRSLFNRMSRGLMGRPFPVL